MPNPVCLNCGIASWGAKNDSYCDKCEREWYQVLSLVFRPASSGTNPLQSFADSILLSVLDSQKPE